MSADKEQLRKQLSEKGFSDEEIDKILNDGPPGELHWYGKPEEDQS